MLEEERLEEGSIGVRVTTTEQLAGAGALLDRLRHGDVHGKALIRT
jgi:hypothetical protein